jgi:hypothetical protein
MDPREEESQRELQNPPRYNRETPPWAAHGEGGDPRGPPRPHALAPHSHPRIPSLKLFLNLSLSLSESLSISVSL